MMPEFTLENAQNGKVVDSSKFKDKVKLITFFATWCRPCIREIPSLIDLQKKFKKKGFSVIAISVDDGPKLVKKIIIKTGINYPVFMANNQITRDFGGVAGIPVSFLVNRKGKVIKNYPGYAPSSILESDIAEIIE
ncbi:MAG: TlpA disulfide reductase family protein [Desulfobia sp.]